MTAAAVIFATALACAPAKGPAANGEVGAPAPGAEGSGWATGSPWVVAADPIVSIGVDAGDDPYMFYRVRDVLRLPDERILVSDAGAHEVRLFDPAGIFIRASGSLGQGPGEYAEPASMDIFGPTPAGQVLVSDTFNARLNVIDTDNAYATQITLEGAEGSRGGVIGLFSDGSLLHIGSDGDGRLRPDNPGTIIRTRGRLRRYSEEGEPLEVLAYFDDRPRYVNEINGVTNFPYIPFTAEAQRAAVGETLWMTSGADPEVWGVDFDGNEVGRASWQLPDRIRSSDVWERYVEESLAELSERRYEQYRHLYQQELPIPEYVPAYQNMIADELGNLWLERYRLPWQTQPQWDVIDRDRGRLGTVETPPRFQVLQITADAVIGVYRDEGGVTRVQVLGLQK
jgi:hypothetical protein